MHCANLKWLPAQVTLTVIDSKLITYDRRVHTGVYSAVALAIIMHAIQGQETGVEACPLCCTQVNLQFNDINSTVHIQVIIICVYRQNISVL